MSGASPFLQRLRNRIDLASVPFTERGSRILLFCDGARFHIKLAERWAAWEREYGHYRRRVPLVRGLTMLGASGDALPLDVTSYPHELEAQTSAGLFGWMFLDEETLYLQLPAGACGVRFDVLAAGGRPDRRGGEFKGEPTHGDTHRNVAYTTNARITANSIAARSRPKIV